MKKHVTRSVMDYRLRTHCYSSIKLTISRKENSFCPTASFHLPSSAVEDSHGFLSISTTVSGSSFQVACYAYIKQIKGNLWY